MIPSLTRAKRSFFRSCQRLGLFDVARRLTAPALRILCYHGVAGGGLPRLHPGLFMDPSTFADRLELLARRQYPVLELGRALELRDRNALPPCATVITFDDGFHGMLDHVGPALARYGFPATLYATTYYSVNQNPVFRLAVRHLLSRSSMASVVVDGIAPGIVGKVSLKDPEARTRLARQITAVGEGEADEQARCEIAVRLGERVGVDYTDLARSRALNLMTPEELGRLPKLGIDVQLHTHRHRLPVDAHSALREITDNRRVLAGLSSSPLQHLCYPSGLWSGEHWPVLNQAGVASATTCDPGLNWPETPRFALRRTLDSDALADVEVEAELSGFSELVRRRRHGLLGLSLDRPVGGTTVGAFYGVEELAAAAAPMMLF